MTISLTYDQVKELSPCNEGFSTAAKLLGGKKGWNGNLVTAKQAREAGVDFDDLIWVASALAKTDRDVERKLRLWMADCAAHVLHIYEKTETSNAPREAIVAARKFARGEIGDAARDAAGAAARDAARDAAGDAAGAAAWAAAWDAPGDAARDAEKEWQEQRFLLWFSDKEPRCYPLPKRKA